MMLTRVSSFVLCSLLAHVRCARMGVHRASPGLAEGEDVGLEGQDQEERRRCMRDKEVQPAGELEERNGVKLPTKLRVDSIDNSPPLKGAHCEEQHGCGLFSLKPQSRERLDCVREVPKLLHFVWLDHPLPEKYAKNIASVMHANPDRKTFLWVNQAAQNVSTLTQLLQDKKGDASKLEVKSLEEHKAQFRNWDIVEKEENVGARSDWLRLEALYLYGGIYMDTDFEGKHSFSDYGGVFRWPFVAYSDPKGAYGNLCNCIMSAEKHSPFVKFMIEGWRESSEKFHLGHGALGCPVLTAAYVTYNQPEILKLSQDYMFMRKDGVEPVISSSFDGSWLPAGEK